MPFFLCFSFMFYSMFTPIQQSTAWPPLLRRLELLPGVTPLFREHGRLILSTLSHFLALLPFSISVEYFNCWSEKTQTNIYRHFIWIKSSKYIVQQSRGNKYAPTNKHKQHQIIRIPVVATTITGYKLRPSSRQHVNHYDNAPNYKIQ